VRVLRVVFEVWSCGAVPLPTIAAPTCAGVSAAAVPAVMSRQECSCIMSNDIYDYW
jgi:hypothetical protein